jgi:predicted transcriptional regulator YdeE
MKNIVATIFTLASLYLTSGLHAADYTVIKRPSMTIMGIECRTTNTPEGAAKDIPQLWGKFYREDCLNKIPNKSSNEIISLYCDYEGDFTRPYSVVIGCPVSCVGKVPEGMVVKTIPACHYAHFKAIGEQPASVIETWGAIWKTKLPRTYKGDFEIYGDKFYSTPQEVDVMVGIE